ncbi:MAG TPA: nucleotide sugar dehydrogenase, partial [Virgibacillus sp.]|nr:nucleotide sugar dehydrogenase [Virgibacillus sp.]
MTNRNSAKRIVEHDSFIGKDKKKENSPIIGVVGLGYVGLPVAVGFAEKYDVIGFDVNQSKIEELNGHIDHTGEVSKDELKRVSIDFTSEEKKLKKCNYIIVAVPTPITLTKEPDLAYLKSASTIIGRNLTPDTVIVYESTVYPGTTEEVCIPVLEKYSTLTAGVDFHVGYSPERINPGDKTHTFKSNNKVISAQNEHALEKIADVYQNVLSAEIFKALSIKVAEASKIIENTQRDINIAFMNELSLIFNKLNIDTHEVLQAANTKWNFFPFTPGLV